MKRVKKIKVLESIIQNRFHPVGDTRVEIGHFWSILQIYNCVYGLQITIKSLCEVASLFAHRLDSKHQVPDKPINPATVRKYLNLQVSPTQISHTVVTKSISKGVSAASSKAIEEVLLKHNSYGSELHTAILKAVDAGKDQLVETKASVMGGSDFAQVLKLSLALNLLKRRGVIEGYAESENQVSDIIDTINENQKIIIENDLEITVL